LKPRCALPRIALFICRKIDGLMTEIQLIGILALLVILAGASVFFSAVETALFALQPSDIERLKAARKSYSGTISQLVESPRRLISVILLGDVLCNTPLIVVGLAILQEQGIAELPFWASALMIFALIVFFCDLVPKIIGLGLPFRIARFGVANLRWIMPLLDPIARNLERLSEKLVNLVTPVHLHTQRHLAEDEITTLVEMSAEDGTLHEIEREMIAEIIKLADKTAKDCMTPRVDAFAIQDSLTNEEAIELVKQKRFRRVPVYGETPDAIEGVLDVGALLREPDKPYTELMDVPSFVPGTMPAFKLLKSFLSHPQGIAIVVDEHGGVEGVVTLADLVEEIISDALPKKEAGLYIESIGDGRLLANGNARLEDIGEEFDITLEEEGIDTIGGLIFNHLGHLPKPGATIKIGELHIQVRRVSRKRIEEILITHAALDEVAA